MFLVESVISSVLLLSKCLKSKLKKKTSRKSRWHSAILSPVTQGVVSWSDALALAGRRRGGFGRDWCRRGMVDGDSYVNTTYLAVTGTCFHGYHHLLPKL